MKTTTALAVVSLLAGLVGVAYANPQNGTVTAGAGTISVNGKTLTVNQTSNMAVIDWRGFDIAADEITQFQQPSSSSVALNRVNSSSASQIDGTLTANGNLVIVNQNGVMFNRGSRVDVNGLVATTADIDNDAFMNSGGKLNFTRSGNPDASIVNAGQITAATAGLVGFVAPNVINNGVITAKLGRVHLASGDTATVDLYGDSLMEVAVSDAVKNQVVTNHGIISADGGKIALTAAAGGTIVNSLISVQGTLQAQSIGTKNGQIVISAEGSNAVAGNAAANKGKKSGSSKVVVAASVDASGKNSGEHGGTITVTGDDVTIGSSSLLDASGAIGGGTILIGGDFHGAGTTATALTTTVQSGAQILTDALTTGDGGNVAVWSDGSTVFAGNISAHGGAQSGNGGFVETSGHAYLNLTDANGNSGVVRASASNGNAGTWLLDPADITIDGTSSNSTASTPFTANNSGGSHVKASDIVTALNAGMWRKIGRGWRGRSGSMSRSCARCIRCIRRTW